MRVGVFIPQVSPQAGGAYTFQESIIEELEKLSRDHEFYIFHYGENNERMNSNVKYIRIDTPPQTGLLSGLIFLNGEKERSQSPSINSRAF